MKYQANRRFRSIRGSHGFTLLEVLVALVVLSIGLLGLSGLQTLGLRNNHSAFLRSQATLVSADIIDRMRANRDAAFAGRYNLAYASTPPTVSCTVKCTPLQVARMDLRTWRAYVERLPGGGSEVADLGDGAFAIRVRWIDSRDSADPSDDANKQVFETRLQL